MRENIVINTIVFKEMIDAGAKQWETFELVNSLGISKIEIRREWIVDFQNEMEQMAVEGKKHNLQLLYSVPVTLFSEKRFDRSKVLACLDEAEYMQMKMVKFTIGDFDASNLEEIKKLKTSLQNRNMVITVENDQTLQSGKVAALKEFLDCCKEYEIPIYCTYDIGNWYWVNENPMSNTSQLADYVKYIHLKDVLYENNQPTVQFLGDGLVDWRTVLRMLPHNVPLGIEYPCGPRPLEVLHDVIEKLVARN